MAVPISALAAIGQLGAGAINYFSGKKQEKKGAELYEKQLSDLRSGKYNLGLSGAQTEAANLARQYGEQMARQTGQRAAAGQQAAIMAARGGDPRMAAGLGSQVAATDQSIRDAQNAALATSVGAQQNLADVKQDILTQNQQMRQGLEMQEMQRGGAAAEAGRQQKFAGISQAIQSPITGAAVEQQMPGATFGFGQGFKAEDGMKTPGPFSHERNPIHMIDKNGDKVGEATGGELIFNPEQTEAIENLLEDGQAYRLMQFMRSLLSQPQFQESRKNRGGGFVHSDKAMVDFDVSDILGEGDENNKNKTPEELEKEKADRIANRQYRREERKNNRLFNKNERVGRRNDRRNSRMDEEQQRRAVLQAVRDMPVDMLAKFRK